MRALGLWGTVWIALLAGQALASHPRARVGLPAERFPARPVSGGEQVARYVEAYVRALGVQGVRVARVAAVGGRYYVYVAETPSGRGAFTLEVTPDGRIAPRTFPAMAPEMMWNQKYGHRARRDPEAVRERLGPGEAVERARSALARNPELRVGSWEHYYGYVLVFLFDRAGRWAGEAAVNTTTGEVVWARFPDPAPRVFPPGSTPLAGGPPVR